VVRPAVVIVHRSEDNETAVRLRQDLAFVGDLTVRLVPDPERNASLAAYERASVVVAFVTSVSQLVTAPHSTGWEWLFNDLQDRRREAVFVVLDDGRPLASLPPNVVQTLLRFRFVDLRRDFWYQGIAELASKLQSMIAGHSFLLFRPRDGGSRGLDPRDPFRLAAEEAAAADVEARPRDRKRVLAGLHGESLQDTKATEPRDPLPDSVKCTIASPPAAYPGDGLMVQVFAHLPEDEQKVYQSAKGYDALSEVRGSKTLTGDVHRGAILTFMLRMPGVEIDHTLQTLRWTGAPESVQFFIEIPDESPEKNLLGTITVMEGTIPFGQVKFTIRVLREEEEMTWKNAASVKRQWRRYRYAFISYASQDRAEVLKRVQMLDRTGIIFFQDLLSMDPGERWERTLYREIDKSDVLFLFWSTAAKNSQWVLKEVEYALERHGGDDLAPPDIIPILIEGPPPPLPPAELKHLHFNDKFLYFLAGST